jgi:hypothetical protein
MKTVKKSRKNVSRKRTGKRRVGGVGFRSLAKLWASTVAVKNKMQPKSNNLDPKMASLYMKHAQTPHNGLSLPSTSGLKM